MKWWQKIVLNTVIFLVLAEFLNGFEVSNWTTAVLAAVVLSILNGFVKPIISFFSFPLTLLTFGLFYFVINGLMISMTSFFVDGLAIQSFGQAMLVAIIMSIVNSVIASESY